MPAHEFSEFTFGFAFTHEVTAMAWRALGGAPEMPSLFDEGRGKGFDVSIGLVGWTLFVQFKRGSLLTRPSAAQWECYRSKYYRFDIYPRSRSSQHADLLRLEREGPLDWVLYTAPVLHSAQELHDVFLKGEVLDNVRLIAPSAIGELTDEPHCITYSSQRDRPLLHSEPRSIDALDPGTVRERLLQTDWRDEPVSSFEGTSVPAGTDEPLRSPRRLDDRFFDSVAEQMMAIASNQSLAGYVDRVSAQAEAMTSFGRVRTLGRLLFGGELIALPAAGQQV